MNRLISFLSILILSNLACKKNEQPIVSILDVREKATFLKVQQIATAANALWPGFDYVYTFPTYIVFNDPQGNYTSGYLINPPENDLPAEAMEVTDTDLADLDLYRFDGGLAEVQAAMGEQGLFAQLTFGNTTYFAIRELRQNSNFYLDYANQQDDAIPLILIHELFHFYQFGAGGFVIGTYTQDRNNYPLDEASISTHLMISDLMASAYTVQTEPEREDYLDYYVSLMHELVQKDPSDQQLVTNFALKATMVEGSARYIEVFSAQSTIFPTITTDPTYGWHQEIRSTSEVQTVRQFFAFRMWYHTGAIVIKLLVDAGVDVQQGFRQGLTPYDLALNRKNYTEMDHAANRTKAALLVDEIDLATQATRLWNLIQ